MKISEVRRYGDDFADVQNIIRHNLEEYYENNWKSIKKKPGVHYKTFLEGISELQWKQLNDLSFKLHRAKRMMFKNWNAWYQLYTNMDNERDYENQ